MFKAIATCGSPQRVTRFFRSTCGCFGNGDVSTTSMFWKSLPKNRCSYAWFWRRLCTSTLLSLGSHQHAAVDHAVRLARGLFHTRGSVGRCGRAVELFLSMPKAGGDGSQARFRQGSAAELHTAWKNCRCRRTQFEAGAENHAFLGAGLRRTGRRHSFTHGIDRPGRCAQRFRFSQELAALRLGLIGLFTAPAMIFMGLLADRIGRQ